MSAQVKLHALEVLHLFSGPQRHEDLGHWFRVLGASAGYAVNVTDVGCLVECKQYGFVKLDDKLVCRKILKIICTNAFWDYAEGEFL